MGKIQQIVQRFHRQILAYVVKQEEERVHAEATKGQVTHQEFVDEILRQAEKTKREGEYGQGHDTTGRL